MTPFVVIVAVSPDAKNVVLLTKNKGPSFLIGKLTFPGGKDDEGDAHSSMAAARELFEECGVKVPSTAMQFVAGKNAPFGLLETYFVATDISAARTMETEVIQIADFDTVVADARGAGAHKYAPDFIELVDLVTPFVQRVRAQTRGAAAPSPEA